ncbi:MAG: twin-arginine translocase TatA/TatE family subunit [Kiritimatiellae bacterium]|jgi:sec-independent protein translocase protein TatA|nr:twin-arginine translocase TatA/TatE family subunit [Kiritimatiellia bacterium]
MKDFLYLGFNPGLPELVVVLVVILLLFGPKKLPDLSRAIGKSIGEFRRGRQEVDDEVKTVGEDLKKDVNEPASDPKKS